VDEADRMLDMGFIPDIERIFGLTNPLVRQTLFFSATMPPEIERLTKTFLSNPAKIEVARQATTSETITQGCVQFKPSRKDRAASEKRGILRDLIASEGEECRNAIIFCNRKVDVDVVAKSLKKHGLNAEPIHGDLDQSHRTRTLDGFRDGSIRFLVASDVAARGLDIPNVSHVFNFDVPNHAEDYVHRIGRTGRAGREGRAFMIATTPGDDKALAAIEDMIGQDVPRIDRPPRSDGEDERPARRSRARKADEAEAGPESAPELAEEPAVAEAPAPQRENGGDNERRSRRGRGGRGRRSDEDQPVVGMGDHVPDFILRSFA
jgi:ATP-dependent RNA helicase RhlE